jgi:predicted amidohydrolase YtcJ
VNGVDGDDLVLVNGHVITLDPADRRTRGVAIEGGRIRVTGSNDDALANRGARTRIVDLAGRTVIPGLIDGHAHMDREGLRDIFPSLEGARSIADIQARIRGLAARTPRGDWIVTMPIGTPPSYFKPESTLAEGRFPTRHELDAAAPDHPVYIRGIWGYWDKPPITSVANSLALKAAGLTRDTPPPASSVEIEHDADGEPTGIFREHAPVPVLEFTSFACIPRFTHEHRVRGLRTAMARALSAGTTSVYEAHGVAPEVQRVYRQLYEAGEQTVRAHLVLSPTWATAEEGVESIERWMPFASGRGTGDDLLRFGGVFLGLGHPTDATRILFESLPYTAWGGFVEQEFVEADFRALCLAAARNNIRINTLVNDAMALTTVLDTLEAVDREAPIGHLRTVLEHVRDTDVAAIRRMRDLGAIATTQPSAYIWKSGSAFLASGGDPDRLCPHVDFDVEGLPWALSTDNKPYSTLWALAAAVERRDRDGQVLGERQAVTPLRALRALTVDAARLTFEEDRKGSIETGKLADLAVLDAPILEIGPDEIRDLPVPMTIVGGRVVHEITSGLA